MLHVRGTGTRNMRQGVHLDQCYRQSIKFFVESQNKPFTEATLQVKSRNVHLLYWHHTAILWDLRTRWLLNLRCAVYENHNQNASHVFACIDRKYRDDLTKQIAQRAPELEWAAPCSSQPFDRSDAPTFPFSCHPPRPVYLIKTMNQSMWTSARTVVVVHIMWKACASSPIMSTWSLTKLRWN